MKPAKLNKLMLALLYICIAVGILFLVTLHWSLPYVLRLPGNAAPAGDARYLAALACWYIGTAGAILLLCMLTRMVKSLYGDPFVQRNVDYLRRMAYIAIAMACCAFLSAALYDFRPLLIVIGMMEVFCAMLSLVLSGVFAQAVSYKQENDLVI